MKTQLLILLLVILLTFLIPFRKSTYEEDGGRIPKIIHQVAMSKLSHPDTWPENWKMCQKTWREKFPEYEYKLWNDEMAEELIRDEYPWFYNTYKGYDRDIFRIDAIRYFILYHYGGIYADMDFECIKNFESLLPTHKACLCEPPFKSETFQNSLMASPPRHEFWSYVWEYLDENKNETNVFKVAGPEAIMKVAEEHSDMVFTLKREIFTKEYTLLYNPWIKIDDDIDENIVAIHHGGGSWATLEEKLKMFDFKNIAI